MQTFKDPLMVRFFLCENEDRIVLHISRKFARFKSSKNTPHAYGGIGRDVELYYFVKEV
jgi:hypothetical protein